MARKKSFTTLVKQAVREQKKREAGRQREAIARERLGVKEALQRERLRVLQAQDTARQEAAYYVQQKTLEVEEKNAEVATTFAALQGLLQATLDHDDTIDLESLKQDPIFPPLDIPFPLLHAETPPTREGFFGIIQEPTKLAALIPGAKQKHQQALAAAEQAFQQAWMEYQQREQERVNRVTLLTNQHVADKEAYAVEVQEQHAAIDGFITDYRAGTYEAIVAYITMVLERSNYGDLFDQEFKLAYIQDTRTLIIDYSLPGVEIVPAYTNYSYMRSTDSIVGRARKATEIKQMYQDTLVALSLRTLHEVFEADQHEYTDVILFNGYVEGIDKATGKDIRPCLISVRTNREQFMDVDLRRVDLASCFKHLGGRISAKPVEVLPIQPIAEFDMERGVYIDQGNVIKRR